MLWSAGWRAATRNSFKTGPESGVFATRVYVLGVVWLFVVHVFGRFRVCSGSRYNLLVGDTWLVRPPF